MMALSSLACAFGQAFSNRARYTHKLYRCVADNEMTVFVDGVIVMSIKAASFCIPELPLGLVSGCALLFICTSYLLPMQLQLLIS